MFNFFLATGAILGGLSVAAGAFASHALRGQLSDRALEIFDTGARYQMYHALALLAVALLIARTGLPSTTLLIAGYAFIAGTLIFSGSLYALSLSGIKILGAVAPIGGAALIIGWVCLAIVAVGKSVSSS